MVNVPEVDILVLEGHHMMMNGLLKKALSVLQGEIFGSE